MSDAFKREVDKGTVPGVNRAGGAAGAGRLVRCDRPADPAASAPMTHDSIFRIFSMTKPIVSVGIMMLVEDGHFVLGDPVAKFIPEFAEQKVGVENNGKLDLVPVKRQMTVQDLLRHTSGLTYDHTGNGPVQQLYQQSRLRSRKITNAEHAAHEWPSLPLVCQPGVRSGTTAARPTCSGASSRSSAASRLGAFLDRAHPGAAADGRDRHSRHAGGECPPARRAVRGRSVDRRQGRSCSTCWSSRAMESGGGGLVSTTMDYARVSR